MGDKIPSDTELMNYLQKLIDKKTYSGKVVVRIRSQGGLGIQETKSWPGAVPSIREAIMNFMKEHP